MGNYSSNNFKENDENEIENKEVKSIVSWLK